MNFWKTLSLTCLLALGSHAHAQDLKPVHAQKTLNRNQLINHLESVAPFDATKSVLPQEASLIPNTGFVNQILNFAAKHLGRGYRSGGKGPYVFDCSGFVGYVFRHFGFDMGASSRDQYQQGVYIDRQELKPGDLVFFGGRSRGKTRIGHVGIVYHVDENKNVQFIHAATSVGIKIDQFPDGGYYSNRYIGARRIVE